MQKCYGFVYVDEDNKGNGTLLHKKKKSFYWCKRVIQSNAAKL